MSSFDVLNRELNIFGSRLLEASAGTGKTFAIEHLAVRLILESQEPLVLDKILIVTFTRAATRELRMRIRSNLESALSQIRKRSAKFDYLTAILEAGEERVAAAQRRLEDALSTFDQAQIFTIHSFCFRMLREFAFEAKLPLDLVDPEEGDEPARVASSIYDFFRNGFKPPRYGMSQIQQVLSKHQSDFALLAKRLKPLIERRAEIESVPSFEELRIQFNEKLIALPKLDKERALSDYRKIAPNYKRVSIEQGEKQLSTLIDLTEKGGASREEFDALLSVEGWFLQPLHELNLKKRTSIPSSQELAYPGLFTDLRSALLPLFERAKDPLQTMMRMASDCIQESSQKGLTFDGLLHKMSETLSSREFCQRVRSRYRALIVDEFQDTDPIQWKIFHTLFITGAEQPSAIYLVGDPKQSIYGFRGADVYTYLDAARCMHEKAHLGTNFRSDSSLVAALNTLFSARATGEKGWLPLPSQESKLDYIPVKDRGGSEEGFKDGKGAVHFFLAQAEVGRERSWPTAKMERELFFPFIAEEIDRLAFEKGLPFRSFAVLVKDRFQAERLNEYLKQQQIPSTVSRGRSILESQGYPVMQQLLEALLYPSKIKALLTTPLFGLTEEEFKQAPLDRFRELLSTLSKTGEEKGFACMIADFLAASWEGKKISERISETPDLYEEFTAVAELLMEEELKRGRAPLYALLLFMQSLKKSSMSSEETSQMRLHAEEDAVSLMTVHMSKGLEFEVVFALGIASRHTHKEELIFIREKKSERLEKLDRDLASSLLYLQERDAEKMRQLYVALTRAKKRVYIPLAFRMNEEEPASEPELGTQAPVELFFSSFNLQESLLFLEEAKQRASITYSLLDQLNPPLTSRRELPQPPVPQIRSFNMPIFERSLLSFSSLAKKSESEERILLGEEKSAHTLPVGAETGTLLHEILEKIFKKGLSSSSRKDERGLLIQKELKGTLLTGWEEVVIEMIDGALALPLPGIEGSFCLGDLLPHQIAQEMEFLFPMQNNLIKGFADLFFEREGRYYLVDWKSNWLGQTDAAYTLENLEAAMRSHDYFLQGSIYASAFERYVKLFDKRPFDQLFGGAYYLFLRGRAAYHFIPDLP